MWKDEEGDAAAAAAATRCVTRGLVPAAVDVLAFSGQVGLQHRMLVALSRIAHYPVVSAALCTPLAGLAGGDTVLTALPILLLLAEGRQVPGSSQPVPAMVASLAKDVLRKTLRVDKADRLAAAAEVAASAAAATAAAAAVAPGEGTPTAAGGDTEESDTVLPAPVDVAPALLAKINQLGDDDEEEEGEEEA